jgi:hypothetical protein
MHMALDLIFSTRKTREEEREEKSDREKASSCSISVVSGSVFNRAIK